MCVRLWTQGGSSGVRTGNRLCVCFCRRVLREYLAGIDFENGGAVDERVPRATTLITADCSEVRTAQKKVGAFSQEKLVPFSKKKSGAFSQHLLRSDR
jgi:hypothetical protein